MGERRRIGFPVRAKHTKSGNSGAARRGAHAADGRTFGATQRVSEPESTGVPAAGKRKRTTMASRMLFLMADATKRPFSDPGERRWRLLAALTILDGKSKPTAADEAMVDKELSR